MTELELHEKFQKKKEKLLELITQAIRDAGLDTDLAPIQLQIAKRVLVCPPGQVAVFEAVQDPDGTVTYRWVCKPA